MRPWNRYLIHKKRGAIRTKFSCCIRELTATLTIAEVCGCGNVGVVFWSACHRSIATSRMKGVRIRLQNHIVASMPRSYISLGGNLGAVADTFAAALDRLGRIP